MGSLSREQTRPKANVARNPDLRVEHPEPDRAVVVLAGEHDLSTAAELRSLLAQLVDENRVVVIDLSAARFADSMTLNVLVQAKVAADARDCRLRIQMGPDALLHRLFEVAGLIDAMDVTATREQALEASEPEAA
jgi:anti-anti-sigma factor